MTPQEKQLIADALRLYCSRYPSQNKAANSLRDVSPATVSQMLNGKWELINDAMWRKVGSQVGFKEVGKKLVKTSVYNELYTLLSDNQSDNGVSAIIGAAGGGKSTTSKQYISENKNAFRVACSEYWNRKTFLLELLESMGCDPSGYTVHEMMREVCKQLKSLENPILILDEADKLNDQVLYFFITLYNMLEGHCSIILLATDYLKKRILRGVALKKKGYNEIYSRIGRRFIELDGNTYDDMANVARSIGLSNENNIEKVINDSDGDLRRIDKLSKAIIKKNRNAA
ncbi:MAG TPA: ATP-binding protein [Dysgonomonas sp.]|uniref:ATP-binding protein n=1 Tax=unclassified Dysgonomonas TaxID=2630389 RepID=UPI0025C1B96D|nr:MULTISPECIES: ATP-binding protein [unclassified Dysgonomonas]HML64674.1 ATP-binding protein [Dysgonomonas sp.]